MSAALQYVTIWSHMSKENDDQERVWKALADPTRRQILDLLRAQPRTTGELAAGFDSTRFAVMKHLKLLVDAGLVLVERRGRERWNHLNPVPIRQIYRRWIQPFEEVPADRLLRLKRVAERPKAANRKVAKSGHGGRKQKVPPIRKGAKK